jgi:hypothetical protein
VTLARTPWILVFRREYQGLAGYDPVPAVLGNVGRSLLFGSEPTNVSSVSPRGKISVSTGPASTWSARRRRLSLMWLRSASVDLSTNALVPS